MITKWRLFNFKSVRKDTTIEFGPLTLFAGSNSSGKSTIIQTLLLLSQTLASKIHSRSVVLNGHLSRLGAFDDLKSFKGDAEQILIGFELEPIDGSQADAPEARIGTSKRRARPRLQRIQCDISFDAGPSSPRQEILQLQPQLFGCSISSKARRDDGSDTISSIVVSRSSRLPDDQRMLSLDLSNAPAGILSSLSFEVKLDDEPKDLSPPESGASNEPIGAILRHFLPSHVAMRCPKEAGADDLGGKTHEVALTAIAGQTRQAVDYIDRFFSASVKYLGPLRDEPKALYPLATSVDPKDVGLRGEFTAAVLDLHKFEPIVYIPSAQFSEPTIDQTTKTRHFQTAVLDWLKYLGVVEALETGDRGKLGHELKVTTEGVDTPHDLTHVGVGVSQVLPIVVMCLLADRDSTLIFEQPELHLHPRVQSRLADFFLSVSLLGKQCIVETHSEYLINRLRFRVAAASNTQSLESKIHMYFVEKKQGASECRRVDVNRYGALQEWPDGFFDQSQHQAEEILRAAMQKRKQEREAAKNG